MQDKKDDLAIEMSNNLDFKKCFLIETHVFCLCLPFFDRWMFHRQAREQRSGGGELSVSQALRPPDPAQHRVLQRSMVPAGGQSVMLLAMLPPLKLNSNIIATEKLPPKP